MVLEDYLEISRRRQGTLMPLFKLQLHMLQDLVLAEKAGGHYKKKLGEVLGGGVAQEEDAGNDSESGDESGADSVSSEDGEGQQPAGDEVRAIKRELYFLRAEVRALRDIADGIAWRLFDYDRAVLHELARRPTQQHVNSEGLLAELYAFASYFNDRSGIAVLNDLTHFLKFGDVTVRLESGDFEIIEVKAGTSGSGRLTRQRQGLNEVVSLLSKDQGREIAGEPVRISAVDVVPEMFAGNVRGLLDRARSDGAAVETVGAHLLIECIDFIAVREKKFEKERVFAVLDRGRAVMAKWNEAKEFVLPFNAHERYAYAQNFAPLSIFPLEPKACVQLASGAIGLTTFVNVSAVLRELESRGWKVMKSPFQLVESREELESIGRETPIAVLKKGRLTTSIPAALLGRLGMEFLKPRSLAQLLDGMLEQQNAAGYQFINFAGEARMWR